MSRLVPNIIPNDYEETIAIGVAFPLTVGTTYQNYTTARQIHDNLRNLILTIPGERVYYPTFGSGLYHLLYEPLSSGELEPAATIAIENAVEEWMPYIAISNVDIVSNPAENKMNIRVQYRVNGWEAGNILNLDVSL